MTFIKDDRSHYECDICRGPMSYANKTIEDLTRAANDTRIMDICTLCWAFLETEIDKLKEKKGKP